MVPVVALFGATATGKTGLACRVADLLPVHLISCDAVQVYRDLQAATAKPVNEELRHPWALVDWVDPGTDLNLGDWVRAAELEIDQARQKNRIPMIVGGTGLYLRGLLKGVAQAPPRDEAIRSRLRALSVRRGPEILHRVLSRLDPPSAARIAPGDLQRVIRALEVRIISGQTLSRLQGAGWAGEDRYPTLRIGLELPREQLYDRIDQRVKEFLEAGLVEEVRWLLEDRGVPPEANSLRAIGYRETVEWLAGCARDVEPFDLAERIQRNTRRFARRQLTWFAKEPDTHWLDPTLADAPERIAELIYDLK